MTVSILESLVMMPDGGRGLALEMEHLGSFFRDRLGLLSDDEKQRNDRHALRDEMFRDGGDRYMSDVVLPDVFEDPEVLRKRRAVVPHAKFSNCLKRIVVEMSTVYAEPARRSVGGSADNQARYTAAVDVLNLDEQMGAVNELLNLHRALFVAPRVRVDAAGEVSLALDIATPSTTRLVCHPLDRTQVVAILVRVDMPMARNPFTRAPAWQLWSDHEQMYLDDRLNPIDGTHVVHGIGSSPWVPLTYSPIATPGFWPGRDGDDLVAARVTEWLTDVLMIKEAKSNKKIPIVSGDASTMARNQAADSEVPISAPEGVSVTTVDMGTDPAPFIATSNHALERTGNNHGLSMGALTHQGVQSAEAREIMLAPVRERRRKQIKIFRRFERRFAVVLSRVLARYAPAMAFDPVGWRIDFGEAAVLLSQRDRLDIFERERRLGLTNTIRFKMSENPDLDEERALAEMVEDILVETRRNELMRPLQAIAGSTGAEMPDAASGESVPAPAPPPPPDLSWVEEVVNAA